MILSATSALDPRNFLPMLSCVVDQITSPSLLTRRTAATASCFRSVLRLLSLSPTFMPPYWERGPRVAVRLLLPLLPPRPKLACACALSLAEWSSVNTRSSAEPRRMASARFQHGAHVVLADFKNHGLLAALIVGESTVK